MSFSHLDLIPTSILARGRRALAAYRRALKSGRTYDKRVKVMLIGQDRAGKTSLGRSLRGEELRYDEASTDGVQMSEPLKNANETAWRYSRRKSSAYEYKCAEMMRQDLLASGARPLIAEETREPEEGTEDTMIQDHIDVKHSGLLDLFTALLQDTKTSVLKARTRCTVQYRVELHHLITPKMNF